MDVIWLNKIELTMLDFSIRYLLVVQFAFGETLDTPTDSVMMNYPIQLYLI